MPRIVNASYSTEAARKGSTIDIPVSTAVGISDVTPAATPTQGPSTTPGLVQVRLDHWKKNQPVYLTHKDIMEVDRNQHFLPGQLGEAVRALANEVNRTVHACYKKVYGFYGTPGVTPFTNNQGVKPATQAMRILSEQLCPPDNRYGVLDHIAQAAAVELPTFHEASKRGSNGVQLTGEIGLAFGTQWVADHGVQTHVAGTIANDSDDRECAVNNVGGYPAGTTTINVDQGGATSVTGTIVVGDIISFAGHDQTYAVVANTGSNQYDADNEEYTFSSSAINGLSFYPALKAPVADDEVITVQPTHKVNLVFHRDAFALAMRPLQQENDFYNQLGGSRFMTMQDPLTGLVLRLEVSLQYKQVAWEFDLLWGTELVRPEFAMRLAG